MRFFTHNSMSRLPENQVSDSCRAWYLHLR